MSPVHDQSYRRYQGSRRSPGRAWSVILRTGVRAFLAKRGLIGLLVVAWLPFLVRSVQIYLTVTYPQARQILRVDARMFQSFVEQQSVFMFFVAVYVGAGLIANDRRANALQVYLSKSLTRLEYVGGKLAILATFLGMVTLVPAVLLLAMQVALAGEFTFLRDNPFVVPAVVVTGLSRVIVSALTMLALSSLSNSARYVAVMYTGIVLCSEAVYGVLTFVTGSTRVAWVSITANFAVVSDAVFRQPPRYETPVAVSVLVLTALVAVSLSVLERRVRGVEVVS